MFELPEKITVWNVISNDGFGGKSYSRTTASARISYKQEKFTDRNGDQQISKAVCYSDSVDLLNTSKVFFGESFDLKPISKSDDVRALSATPSSTNLKKAWF